MTKAFEILKSFNIKTLFLVALVLILGLITPAWAAQGQKCGDSVCDEDRICVRYTGSNSSFCLKEKTYEKNKDGTYKGYEKVTGDFVIDHTAVSCGDTADQHCTTGQRCIRCLKSSSSRTEENNSSSTVTRFLCIGQEMSPRDYLKTSDYGNCFAAVNGGISSLEDVTDEAGGKSTTVTKSYSYCEDPAIKCSIKCYYDEIKNKCSFCPLFAVFFNTASTLTKKAINRYSGSVTKVVIVGFALWIAFQILAFVSTTEVRDLKDLVLAIITQSFFVIIAVGLLESGALSFLNDGLKPIYTTGTNAAQKILAPADFGTKTGSLVESEAQKKPEAFTCPSMARYHIATNEEGALPPEMAEGILCTMSLIQTRAATVQAMGSGSICYSWQERTLLIPHLGYLLIGLGLWIGGTIIILAVPFMMIDAVLQLAVAGMLLPFAIGAYAFKITRQYTGKVWETFLNSMFAFVFISLIALMITAAYEGIIFDNVDAAGKMFGDYNTEFKTLLSDWAWFGVKFLKVCFVLILSWAVIGEASDFAKQFSGSITSTKIGSSIGAMAGSFSKNSATRILGRPTKAATGKLWDGAKNAMAGSVHQARKFNLGSRSEELQKNGTFDAKTATYNKSSISENGSSQSHSLYVAPDGDKTLTESNIRNLNKGGTETVKKVTNKHFTVTTTTVRDSQGNVISHREKVQENSNYLRHLVEKDGTINQENLNKALGAFKGHPDEEMLTIALQKQILSKVMPHTKINMKNHSYVSQKLVRNEKGEVIGFEEIHADGSKTFANMNMNKLENGRMMVGLLQTDENGQGTMLKTDGVINKKQAFGAQGDLGEMSFEQWDALINSGDIKTKDTYGYSKYYEYYNQTKRYSQLKEGLKGSRFAEDEVRATQIFTANNGNIRATASMFEFERYYE